MFDEETAVYAANEATRKLESTGQIGRIAPDEVYTFDGNADGRIIVPYNSEVDFVKISDAMPNLFELRELTQFQLAGTGGEFETFTADQFSISEVGEGDQDLFGARGIVALRKDGTPLLVVVTDTATSPIPETGLYVVCVAVNSRPIFYVADIKIKGGITPISDKYLPGPVVIDFGKLGIGEAFNELIGKGGGSTGVTLPADFWEGLPINRPIMIRTEIIAFGYSMTAPATVFHETDGTFVITVSAKEIINGSLVTVNLYRVTSSISVQMIPLA